MHNYPSNRHPSEDMTPLTVPVSVSSFLSGVGSSAYQRRDRIHNSYESLLCRGRSNLKVRCGLRFGYTSSLSPLKTVLIDGITKEKNDGTEKCEIDTQRNLSTQNVTFFQRFVLNVLFKFLSLIFSKGKCKDLR